jgi:hypothetical protein
MKTIMAHFKENNSHLALLQTLVKTHPGHQASLDLVKNSHDMVLQLLASSNEKLQSESTDPDGEYFLFYLINHLLIYC